jgi:hypothetical protein
MVGASAIQKMIPDWLTQKLATPPAAGTGLHAWLFSCARQLHAHMSAAEIIATLTTATHGASRHVSEREIRDAVNNSKDIAWTPGGAKSEARAQTGDSQARGAGWPRFDQNSREIRIRESFMDGLACLGGLWDRSPTRPGKQTADDWIDVLFPGAEWLCLALDHPGTARSRKREAWLFCSSDHSLIVPSPMTGPGGNGLDGRRAHRCLDNTGPRRWLVIEFDSGTIDAQAALHWCLKRAADALQWPPLGLIVHSAGKSLHGWYRVNNEESARELMAYAISIGADPPTWTRCQMIRLPEGRRDRPAAATQYHLPDGWEIPSPETRQRVYFYDPAQC